MFTGLVAAVGRVKALSRKNSELFLTLEAPGPFEPGLALGESVAVNGACLTVTTLLGDRAFTAYASAETVSQTTLGDLAAGAAVNLERALAFGDRLGGHLVTGHVDGVGRVLGRSQAGESLVFRIGFPPALAAGLVVKGSVAVDGVSLTVNEVATDSFTFNLIPHSAGQTILGFKKPGDCVNLETDLIGKYLSRWLEVWAGSGQKAAPPAGALSAEFLARHGFDK